MQRARNYISRLILLFSTFLRIKHVRLGRFRCRICIRLRLNIYLCSINHFRTVFENVSTLAASEKGLCTYKTFTSMQISTLSTCPIGCWTLQSLPFLGQDLFTLPLELPEVVELPQCLLNLGLYWIQNEPLP